MKIFSRPRYLFLTLFTFFFLLINLIDILHGGLARIGTFFLSQSLAVIFTTIAILLRPKWRGGTLPWLAAAVATLMIVMHSYNTFHSELYSRIPTEADGPATVGYACEYGEAYTTVTDITGIQERSVRAINPNANLCWLKNMPLAASNASLYSRDFDSDGIVLFSTYEIIIGASYLLSRKLLKTYNSKKVTSVGKYKK